MKEGAKPLLFHTIHMVMVLYFIVITLIFFPCLGIDGVDKYTFFYRNGEYTLLYHFYGLSLLFCLSILLVLGWFHVVPYGIMYWIKYWRNPGLENAKEGIFLSVVSFLLVIAHPFGPIYLSDLVDRYIEFLSMFFGSLNWLAIFLYIVLSTYIVPYYFIRLSYPQLTTLHIYKVYSVFLISQLIVNLFLIAFSMEAFPELHEALKTFIDSRYSRW